MSSRVFRTKWRAIICPVLYKWQPFWKVLQIKESVWEKLSSPKPGRKKKNKLSTTFALAKFYDCRTKFLCRANKVKAKTENVAFIWMEIRPQLRPFNLQSFCRQRKIQLHYVTVLSSFYCSTSANAKDM